MKKKLLIIINSATGGGAEKVLLDMLKKLNTQKYEIDLFLLKESGIYLEEFKKNCNEINFLIKKDNKITKIPIFGKILSFLTIRIFCRISNFRILKKINNKKYDLEISFLEGLVTQYLSNRKIEAKKIAWVHTDLEKHRFFSKKIEKKIYEKIDNIVCVSEDSRKSLLNLYPEFKNKTEVIYNPILKSEILEKSLEKVEKITDESKITLIASGRLTSQKGFDILLEAHKELLEEGLDYNLKILGDGPLKMEFQKYIQKNNIGKNTELLGFKKNPYAYIKQADIFVVSSRYEGYSLVLAEALTLKIPVISTKCIGPLEILDNGRYGLMAECESIESLKENIRKLITDENLRIHLKKLSKERSSIFDSEKVISDIENLFDRSNQSDR